MVPKKDIYNVSYPRTNGKSGINSHLAKRSLEDSYHEIDRVVFFSDDERLELAKKARVKLLKLRDNLDNYLLDEDERELVKYIAFLIGRLERARNKDEYLVVINEKLDEINNKLKNVEKDIKK